MATDLALAVAKTDAKPKEAAEDGCHVYDKPQFIETDVWKRANYYSCTRRVLEYLQVAFDKRIGLSKMAAVACMERTTFSKAFKQKTGIRLHKFVQAYRVSQAAAQMEASDCSITEVAFNTGFSNLDTFARAFKKIAGITPSLYRLEIRRKNGLMVEIPMRSAAHPDRAGELPRPVETPASRCDKAALEFAWK